jgi:hypothetical protein
MRTSAIPKPTHGAVRSSENPRLAPRAPPDAVSTERLRLGITVSVSSRALHAGVAIVSRGVASGGGIGLRIQPNAGNHQEHVNSAMFLRLLAAPLLPPRAGLKRVGFCQITDELRSRRTLWTDYNIAKYYVRSF